MNQKVKNLFLKGEEAEIEIEIDIVIEILEKERWEEKKEKDLYIKKRGI